MSTITRKPKPGQGAKPSTQEDKIKAVIFKGMASPAETTSAGSEETEQQVKLRLPLSLLQKIDAAVKSQRIKTSRHRWLMEAIIEKLGRAS
jgi:hypothetical protein